MDKYDTVGDVRGSGLFQGVEFVKSRKSPKLEPHPDLTKFVVDYLKYKRVLISRDGPDANVIKVCLPIYLSLYLLVKMFG
jgi:4-aminobutyrate aminotransferase-like enzyme